MTKPVAYSAVNESIKLGILFGILCISLLYGDWLWRLDRLIYDAQASLITHQASDDIVIIAIDEASLKAIGRWPWPRNVHAKLINILTELQAKAIFFDVIFSEPSRDRLEDSKLAQTFKNNGKVLLPVLLEQSRAQGQLLETLPLPALTLASAALGHVHVELDPDGIARGTYLYEGLGEARWPHIGLAVWKMLEPEQYPSHTNTVAEIQSASSWSWVRKDHFLIPYIGPPGSYNTTSYINVINRQVLTDTLKDKIVLVGVTASGLGDSLPTPVSGLTHPMPGIEINANIIQAVKSGSLTHSLNANIHYLISVFLVILPILSFPYLSPRTSLFFIISEISLIFITALFVLHTLHIWVPLSATLVCISIAYPLWSWRRLEFTVQYLNSELEVLSRETGELEKFVAHDEAQPFSLLQSLVPIKGMAIYDNNENILINFDSTFNKKPLGTASFEWIQIADKSYSIKVSTDNNFFILYLNWGLDSQPDEQQTKIIKTYSRQVIRNLSKNLKSTSEVIELRTHQIQQTTSKIAYLRHFITDSLEQMADGIIVINNLGIVTLANKQAIRYLNFEDNTGLLNKSIIPLLNSVAVLNGESWENIVNQVLSNKQYNNIQVHTPDNKDLIINIKSLHTDEGPLTGFIINLSDISEIKRAQRKQSEMLSFLSHDFRSPLVSVLAMLEHNKTSLNDINLTNRISNNINRTIQLAEDFIHLSRVESESSITLSDINFSDIIANSIDTVWDLAIKKNIEIQESVPSESWIHANGAIMERVIVNLLTNAITHSNENCKILVTLNKSENVVICCVEDNGAGIRKEDLDNIFDRFQRSGDKPSPGIGLGLAFVHAAMTRHGGSVSVASELNKYSRFCISIPVEHK